jgi:tRNA threonylcarbamoyladenosine biosynthesis protein TsaB
VRIVAIDTAGPVAGVAVAAGAAVRSRTERVSRGAEARLVPWILELAEELGLALADIDGVAIAVGPGAFTGLRVGIATGCGLAQALDRPVWAGCTLRARAHAALGAGRPVLSALDARKSRVYAALYAPDGRVLRAPADVAPEVAIGWAGPGALATGEGALIYREAFRAAGIEIALDADDPGVLGLLALARAGLSAGEGIGPLRVSPVYLRAPDAKPPAVGPR